MSWIDCYSIVFCLRLLLPYLMGTQKIKFFSNKSSKNFQVFIEESTQAFVIILPTYATLLWFVTPRLIKFFSLSVV